MNNRGHLPAGQPMQGGGGGEMGPGPGGGGGPGHGHGHGHGHGQGPRRGGARQYYPPSHYHHHVNSHPMYPANNYGSSYGAPYYPPIPPQYANGPMTTPAFYQQYTRSPPAMPQYVPMVGVGIAPTYSRPPQHSPVVSSQFQQPPPASMPVPIPVSIPVPVPPQTPSSTQSSQLAPPPMTPPTPQSREPLVLHSHPPAHVQQPPQPRPVVQLPSEPFRPPLPWYSRPDVPFPTKMTKSKRKRRIPAADAEDVELPIREREAAASPAPETEPAQAATQTVPVDPDHLSVTPKVTTGPPSSVAEPSVGRSETPSTQDHPSEYAASTSPTTPSSVQATQSSTTETITPTKPLKAPLRQTVPAIPVIPALPKTSPKDIKPSGGAEKSQVQENHVADLPATAVSEKDTAVGLVKDEEAASGGDEKVESKPIPAQVKTAPKLWTGLFTNSSNATATVPAGHGNTNGDAVAPDASGAQGSGAVPGLARSNSGSLVEALRAYRVGNGEKLAFIEPKGLINTGNMCYMNSVLQVLVFCIPFYDFLDQASKKAAHSFKSETPLIDAMIMFMHEFKVIDSAPSAEQLRRRLKNEELEQYGEPFTPEFVYDAIRKLPRFASMRRGHQQDAEEFLGFLLESLHEECAQILRISPAPGASSAPTHTPTPSVSSKTNEATDPSEIWLEVGPKQRSAVTRSSGHSNVSSPITKIFGGQLRSELRVPGLKDSVTLEPYQPLQLDIGAPNIRNIIDALKGLTRPETLRGDFNSPRGKDVTATKTVFIESLPPVLILHLKRFQFDAEGNGTVKIWKKIGYPLDLEIPREVFSRQKRNTVLAEGTGLPRYRLIAVVYHHGKNASGGHYTVDVRRQDGREWVRLDDTVIRRIRSEDVAEAGAEEDGARTPEPGGRGGQSSGTATPAALANRFMGMNDEDTGDEEGWKQVSGAVNGGKKWSSVVNGAAAAGGSTAGAGPAPAKGKLAKDNVKDNKVAYLLFYQRI